MQTIVDKRSANLLYLCVEFHCTHNNKYNDKTVKQLIANNIFQLSHEQYKAFNYQYY